MKSFNLSSLLFTSFSTATTWMEVSLLSLDLLCELGHLLDLRSVGLGVESVGQRRREIH